jgi:hypothetical protein
MNRREVLRVLWDMHRKEKRNVYALKFYTTDDLRTLHHVSAGTSIDLISLPAKVPSYSRPNASRIREMIGQPPFLLVIDLSRIAADTKNALAAGRRPAHHRARVDIAGVGEMSAESEVIAASAGADRPPARRKTREGLSTVAPCPVTSSTPRRLLSVSQDARCDASVANAVRNRVGREPPAPGSPHFSPIPKRDQHLTATAANRAAICCRRAASRSRVPCPLPRASS